MSCDESQQTHDDLRLLLILRDEENATMPEQKDLYRAYLTIATFCEKILHEANGAISVIRMIDRFTIPGVTPEMVNSTLNFSLLIIFRAGFLRGKQTVSVRPRSPEGQEMPSWNFPVLFEGDNDRGTGVEAQLNMVVNKEGLYWFDIHLNDELVTRMPLRIVYQQTALSSSGG